VRIFFLLFFVLSMVACAESPNGVQPYEENGGYEYPPGPLDGYTYFGGAEGFLYLIDMEGNIVFQTNNVTNFGTKFLPGGSILGPDWQVSHEQSNHGIVQMAWDGRLEWSYFHWENVPHFGWTARQHHDLQREGNPVGYYAPGQDFVENGKTLVLALADNVISEEVCGTEVPVLDGIIYEVDWSGNPTFQWNAADHVTEFGYHEADMDFICDQDGEDYLHINSISRLGYNHWYDNGDTRFHPENIILDSRDAAWTVIIDHQTGNVVWRIGPYYSEEYPEAVLKPIIGPHHAHMIPRGLPGEGNIILFDNGGASGLATLSTRLFSRVIEFDPTTLETVWEYDADPSGDAQPLRFSPLISGVQRLPNGNTLITSGVLGQMIEVSPEKEIEWEFINPYRTLPELSEAVPGRTVYRSARIPPQWLPAEENRAGYSDWY